MPLPIQLVLELRYWEQLSDSEIAEVLDLPIGTVKTRIRAGRVELRQEIARLVSSPEQLQSTLDSLDQWASRIYMRTAGAAQAVALDKVAHPTEIASASSPVDAASVERSLFPAMPAHR